MHKMAEMANLETSGLIQCHSEWFPTTLVNPRGVLLIEELTPFCVMMTAGSEGKLPCGHVFHSE